MRLPLIAFALLVLVGSVPPASADTLATPADVRKLADGVMGSVGAGNYSGAVKQIQQYAVLPATDFDVFAAQFTSQLPSMLQRYGSSVGSEFVRQDAAGESLIRLLYIAKHEKSAIRWVFVFYRGEKGWVLSDFKFDGNLLALFPSAS